jgi:4-amino-4-deoxychorismate lyase
MLIQVSLSLASANFRKYPNPHSPHVISCDVLSRKVSNMEIHTTRLLCLQQQVPSFIKPFVSDPSTFFIEHSVLDGKTGEYSATTTNLSLRDYFIAEENISFKKTNTTQTLFKCTASISGRSPCF